jgi:hypothetical protein
MRCYNGCPDSQLQAIIDEKSKLWGEMKKLNPEAHCTHHHGFGWRVHEWGFPITDFHNSEVSALRDAIATLKGVSNG